jgi:tetratricopeptide (TPR) repeat protein
MLLLKNVSNIYRGNILNFKLKARNVRLKMAHNIEEPKIECKALCNLGIALIGRDDISCAIRHLDRSLEISHKIEYRRLEGEALFNKSLALDKLGQRQNAIENAKAALVIFEQIESFQAEEVRKKLAEWQGQE